MLNRLIAGAAMAAVAMVFGGPALAHPHVFAQANVEIVGGPDGHLVSVRNIWRMDELFSSSVLVDFDRNANGVLDDEELDAVGQTVKDSIAEWNFYTYVTVDERKARMAPPDKIRTLWDDGQILMFFEMKADEPIDLAKHKIVVTNFDETFFVAFDFNGADDFQFVDMPKACTKRFVVPDEDAAARQWIDQVAKLGSDEEIPEDGINYSQILAARLEVSCAAAS